MFWKNFLIVLALFNFSPLHATELRCSHHGWSKLGSSYTEYAFASVYAHRFEQARIDGYRCNFDWFSGEGVLVRTWIATPDTVQKTAMYTLSTDDKVFANKKRNRSQPNGVVGKPVSLTDGWKLQKFQGRTHSYPSFHYMIYKPLDWPKSEVFLLATTQRYLVDRALTKDEEGRVIAALRTFGNKSYTFANEQWKLVDEKAIKRAFRLKEKNQKPKVNSEVPYER